jgi:hypothetical protein
VDLIAAVFFRKFDGDYYIGDLLNFQDYAHVLTFRPFWMGHILPRIADVNDVSVFFFFFLLLLFGVSEEPQRRCPILLC